MKIKTTVRGGLAVATTTVLRPGSRGCGGGGGFPILTAVRLV